MEELEANTGLYSGGLSQAGVTSLLDGRGRLCVFQARLSPCRSGEVWTLTGWGAEGHRLAGA